RIARSWSQRPYSVPSFLVCPANHLRQAYGGPVALAKAGAGLYPSFLAHRLDAEPRGELIEPRQICRQRALQAIGLAFQLGLEVLENRPRVPDRLAVAGDHGAQQRAQAVVRPDRKIQWILVALIAHLVHVLFDGVQLLRELLGDRLDVGILRFLDPIRELAF